MVYKIAVGSSDGEYTDLKFGEIKEFFVYHTDGEKIIKTEKRKVPVGDADAGCGTESGCNPGCNGGAGGCTGSNGMADKVEIIGDCRCIICKKIGFQAQKILEKKAISVFDIEYKTEDALKKIIEYYHKVDNHRQKV